MRKGRKVAPSLSVTLEDGRAELVGDGMVLVLQKDDETRKMHSVALCRADLEAMLAAL